MYFSKKQQIIHTATDMFAEYGISNVSLKMIAEALGATRGMIYHHFAGGKEEIVSRILDEYEEYINSCVPDKAEWVSPDVPAREILFRLFFDFPEDKAIWLRKVVRIVMSNMYYNEQIAEYAKTLLMDGREMLLSDCFQSLVDSGKIEPLDAGSMARVLNHLLLGYAMRDALLYPYSGNAHEAVKQGEKATRDCTNLMNYILSSKRRYCADCFHNSQKSLYTVPITVKNIF